MTNAWVSCSQGLANLWSEAQVENSCYCKQADIIMSNLVSYLIECECRKMGVGQSIKALKIISLRAQTSTEAQRLKAFPRKANQSFGGRMEAGAPTFHHVWKSCSRSSWKFQSSYLLIGIRNYAFHARLHKTSLSVQEKLEVRTHFALKLLLKIWWSC